MDLLRDTPYLLDESEGPRALGEARKLQEEVALLRKRGVLEPVTLRELEREWRLEQVYESAGIEGNSLTQSETQMAVQRGITVSGKPPEHSEQVRHLNRALEYLEELATARTPLSEWEVRELQKLVVGQDEPRSGQYRAIEVSITNSPHRPPHPVKVPEQMAEFGRWLQQASTLPAALHAAIAHSWLVHIHPFADGNGRTARAIMNLVLLREGYPIVIIRRKDRQRYYEALRVSDQGDITQMVELIVERSYDSLRQIDRVRTAAAGVSLAIQRLQEKEAREYAIWSDAMRLFRSTLEDALKGLPGRDPAFLVNTLSYDLPSQTDFHLLTQRDSSGNTWLFKVKLSRHGFSHELLLWLGFSSTELERELHAPGAIPAIKVSVENPSPPPRYSLPRPDYQPAVREIAYSDGRFYRLDATSAGFRLRPFDNLTVLCSELVADLLSAWFAR